MEMAKQNCSGYSEHKTYERRSKCYRITKEKNYEQIVRKSNYYFQKMRNNNSLRRELSSLQPKEGEHTKHWVDDR